MGPEGGKEILQQVEDERGVQVGQHDVEAPGTDRLNGAKVERMVDALDPEVSTGGLNRDWIRIASGEAGGAQKMAGVQQNAAACPDIEDLKPLHGGVLKGREGELGALMRTRSKALASGHGNENSTLWDRDLRHPLRNQKEAITHGYGLPLSTGVSHPIPIIGILNRRIGEGQALSQIPCLLEVQKIRIKPHSAIRQWGLRDAQHASLVQFRNDEIRLCRIYFQAQHLHAFEYATFAKGRLGEPMTDWGARN